MVDFLRVLVGAGSLSLLVIANSVHGALIPDGGFESFGEFALGTHACRATPGVLCTLYAGESLGAWHVYNPLAPVPADFSQPSVDGIFSNYWESSEGNWSLELNGDNAGAIRQSIQTVAGDSYRLVFDLAANSDGLNEGTMRVKVGEAISEFAFSSYGHSRTEMGWSTHAVFFMAGGMATDIAFESLTAGSAGGAVIDNVRLVRANEIPIAPTLPLVMAGLGVLAALSRRGTVAA